MRCDVLFIQEHWLSEEQLPILNALSTTHSSMGYVVLGLRMFCLAGHMAAVSFYGGKDRLSHHEAERLTLLQKTNSHCYGSVSYTHLTLPTKRIV